MILNVPFKKHDTYAAVMGGVGVVVNTFVQRAGNVVQTAVSISNSIPFTDAAARESEVAIVLPHGKIVNVFDLAVHPLKTWTEVFYTGGTEREFWDKWRGNKLPGQTERLCKPWMREGLDAIFLDIITKNMGYVGPYRINWYHDKSGNGPGGQGIEPHRHLWRNCGSGRGIAFRAATGTANRMDVFVTDVLGNPTRINWVRTTTEAQDETLLAKNGFDRSDMNGYEYENELLVYSRIDGQHFSRACQDALWLARQGHPWAVWYVEHLLNWQASVYLDSTGDEKPNEGYWSLYKILQDTSGPQKQHCGRAGVHQARFAQEAAKVSGLSGRFRGEAIVLSRLWAGVFRKSAGKLPRNLDVYGAQGISYAIREEEMTHSSWAGFPDSWGAQTRELYLAISLFDGWGMGRHAERIRQHPAMQGLPSAKVSLSSGWQSPEGLNPYYAMLVDPTNLEELDSFMSPSGIDLLRFVAKTRLKPSLGVENGGAQPLNSCPREVLEQL